MIGNNKRVNSSEHHDDIVRVFAAMKHYLIEYTDPERSDSRHFYTTDSDGLINACRRDNVLHVTPLPTNREIEETYHHLGLSNDWDHNTTPNTIKKITRKQHYIYTFATHPTYKRVCCPALGVQWNVNNTHTR